jgi:hypothetical protein
MRWRGCVCRIWSWFALPGWCADGEDEEGKWGGEEKRVTLKGKMGPPTSLWKLALVVWVMVLNTLFKLCWPIWCGDLIGLIGRLGQRGLYWVGYGISLLAGADMWWEGRKVKKIEGPVVKVMDTTSVEKVGE